MPETIVTITLPELGESVTEGSIVEWRVKVGQAIAEGDTLVDITTDKVDVEVPATAGGVITALHGGEGDTIRVGTVLAEIDTSATAGTSAPSNGAAANGTPSAPATKTPEVTPSSYGAPGAGSAPPVAHANGSGASSGLASFHARRTAARANVELASIRGSGPDGLIVREDVEAAIAAGTAKAAAASGNGAAAKPAAPQPPVARDAKITTLKGPAAALASYMEQSLTLPTATSFRTLVVAALDERRAALNAALKAAGRSEKISFTHLIAWALVQAAKAMPAMTVSFRRDGDTPQRVEAGIHLGLAVDSERKDGSRFLIVPVIKNADTLDFAGFRTNYEELVAKARDNKLAADDLSGGTFTLTNPGGIGTIASVPRLLPGQGAIIAAGSIAYPVGFSGVAPKVLEQLGIRKVLTLTSTYDHRVIQGAQSGEFLKRIDDLLGGAIGFYEAVFASLGVAEGTAAPASPASSANAAAPVAAPTVGAPASDEMLRAIAAGMAIVESYRRHGHLAATLDPLGNEPVGDPSLDPRNYNLPPALQNSVPAAVLRVKVEGDTLAAVLPRLRETYSSTIAYEIEHISNTAQREWLREYIESGMHRTPLSPQRKVQVLERLTKVETMERYFRKQFMSQKTFSIEGLDVMVPMLEEAISILGEGGTSTAVIGMAHRGRLSTIAHVVNRPYEELLAEFEAGAQRSAFEEQNEDDITGDVKYHHGADGTYTTPGGATVAVRLANNPSHLEAVNGVVEGIARCLQTDHTTNMASVDASVAAAIIIHGDAAFPGQGVVAEVLNLQALPGYATGGTLHIISNNQIGFTTDPSDGRSTRYASDLAKGFDAPIVHVNADDVDACIAAVHLAIDFRRKFGRDVVLDLIGYRRFGHNEQDEPAYTQPFMYELIKAHPTVRELFAATLVAQGAITSDDVRTMQESATARISEAHKNVRGGSAAKLIVNGRSSNGRVDAPLRTAVDREALVAFSDAVVATPPEFTVNTKLVRQFERRKGALQQNGEVDWGLAEGLAFASLLAEGTPIRITGQDTERGTFSQRHAVLHDPKTGERYAPLQHLAAAKASFEIYNSPLSEYACLAFEYGYSGALPNAMVLWEAQYGDFNNGAQIVIDQFIAAGQAKWNQPSRLTMLLPHGYEGSGPEHSSARLERFLQLSAEGNIRVANCSTAAQYFHLLRWQAKDAQAYPLVVMTPKSLLRNAVAYGRLEELAKGSFHEVIDDPRYTGGNRESVTRLLLCSGKVYHDLASSADKETKAMYEGLRETAIVRIELLSPLPVDETLAIIESYPNAKQVIWVQEEPKNMGARAHVRRRLIERLPNRIDDIRYIGRPYRAAPSEGYPGASAIEQERIVRIALTESPPVVASVRATNE